MINNFYDMIKIEFSQFLYVSNYFFYILFQKGKNTNKYS
jgi:hypothetical protein